jgi:integrase
MSEAQRDAFADAVAVDRVHAGCFAVMAWAGLRPSEAYALQPGDLDWVTQTIRVERALDRDRSVKPTKTEDTRPVDMSDELTERLQKYLAWLTAEALRRGWGAPPWLFPTTQGTPLDEARVRKVFKRALARAGLATTFRPYDLRHTYACLLLAKRAEPGYVAAQLGHRNAATLWRHYARWMPADGRPRQVTLLDRRAPAVTTGAAQGGATDLRSAGPAATSGLRIVEPARSHAPRLERPPAGSTIVEPKCVAKRNREERNTS